MGDIGKALKKIPKRKWLPMLEKHMSTISLLSISMTFGIKHIRQNQEWPGNRHCEGFDCRNHLGSGSSLGLTLGELVNFCSPLFLHLENDSPGHGHSS